MSDFAIGFILPQLYLLVFALLALAAGLWSSRDGWLWHAITPASMAIVGLILALEAQGAILFGIIPKVLPLTITQLSQALTIDSGGTVFGMVAVLGTLFVVLMSMDHFREDLRHQGEIYCLLLMSCCAVTFASLAADLLTVYLTIEFLSITSYVLVGIRKFDVRSNEAAIKYFLFGGACSAAMLYGISLLFGLTGTLNLAELGQHLALSQLQTPLVWISVAMILAGLGFKIAAVPFHLWAPDVYEGAPTPITAYLSIVSKAGGLIVLLRLVWTALPNIIDWMSIMVIASAVSMTLGNLAALPQRNIKRMLAYSSIAQAGYILIGFAVLGADVLDPRSLAVSGIIIYVLGYLLANLGAFACVVVVERVTGSAEMEAFAGLSKRSAPVSIALVIFFLSLAGIPPTLGFAGKFWLFAAAIHSNYVALWWLAAIGVANSVISVYYYFNVARAMFFNESPEESHIRMHPASGVTVWTCAAASVVLLIALEPVARSAVENAWLFFTPR